MKVFLGNAPWRKGNRYGVRAGSRWPHWQPPNSVYLPFPFYLAYATSVLEKAGVECKLVDGIAEHDTEKDFIQKAKEFSPDIVLLETSTPTIEVDLAMVRSLKKALGNKVIMILAGPHVTVMKDNFLADYPEVDYLLLGEYEYTLRELVQKLDAHQPIEDVQGISYRNPEGKVICTPRRELIANIDELPWPAYKHLPMLNYNDDFGSLPKPMVQMWASRGCPFKCNFCLWPQVVYANNQYRPRNPVDVVNEMEWLVKTYGFKAVYFDDDTFDLGKKRILELCSEIKKRGLNIPWAAMSRADTLDQEMLDAMADSGMIAIKYGVESGLQELVDGCDKHLDLKKVVETVKMTKKAGIKVHLTFTFGLEGETKETIQKTIDFALAQDPDSVQFSIITPFPGTRYYDQLKEKGYLLTKKWSDFDGNRSAVIRTENLTTEDLVWALNHAYDSWHRYRDQKLANMPYESRPHAMLDNYKPARKKEKVLVLNYADASLLRKTASVLKNKADAGEMTLLSADACCQKPEITADFNQVLSIPSAKGLGKLTSLFSLLNTIRKNHYDLMVFLSDDANSYMRRFPLSLTYFSGAATKLVTDPHGNGYTVTNPWSYLPKLLTHWWKER
jgi:radical SAM superfamily enzyme YgiQ (UPF0313 family)